MTQRFEIEYLALIVGLFFTQLGNMWFTYGLWPRSWWSFALFLLAGLVLALIREALEKERRRNAT